MGSEIHFFPKKILFVGFGKFSSFPLKIIQQMWTSPSTKTTRFTWFWLSQSFLYTVPEPALKIHTFSKEIPLLRGKFLFFVVRNFLRSIKQLWGYLRLCLTKLSPLGCWLSNGWLMSIMEKRHSGNWFKQQFCLLWLLKVTSFHSFQQRKRICTWFKQICFSVE